MAENKRIIVVGAGAAGMMAAGRAAERGAKVLLLEKMERPGKKILISGNGRCNLSNSRDVETFIAQFGPNGHFLHSAFSQFFREDLLILLRRYGIECKTEPNGKIYPTSDNARDVVRAFQRYMADGDVTIRFGTNVTGVLTKNGHATGVRTTTEDLPAAAVIIAAGGSSHPQTGSTGDGFQIAATLGHTIVKLRPALVPLIATGVGQAKQMRSASLRNVRVTAFQCPADRIDFARVREADVRRGISGECARPPVIESRTGDAIVTHFGITGPVILEMSLAVIDALENGPVSVTVDLLPDRNEDELNMELQQALEMDNGRTYRDVIRKLLPTRLVERFIGITGVPPDKPTTQVTLEERGNLLELLKSLRFDIGGAYSMVTAMVTAGGVSLKEINLRTMASQLVDGLYFCGEVMDMDAGTGGYNLQAAFSTGYVAGECSASFVQSNSER